MTSLVIDEEDLVRFDCQERADRPEQLSLGLDVMQLEGKQNRVEDAHKLRKVDRESLFEERP